MPQEAQEELFIEWGSRLFAPTGDNISAFNCAGCHGGMTAIGGVAEYNLTDPATGEVKAVTWVAPALNTIFYRYSEEEVRYILVYGRPFSPMPPWGVERWRPDERPTDRHAAGLPAAASRSSARTAASARTTRTTCPSGHLPADMQQQIDDAANKAVDDGEAASRTARRSTTWPLSSGAYSCARCHTPGWSWGEPGVSGQGALGWNVTGGVRRPSTSPTRPT